MFQGGVHENRENFIKINKRETKKKNLEWVILNLALLLSHKQPKEEDEMPLKKEVLFEEIRSLTFWNFFKEFQGNRKTQKN